MIFPSVCAATPARETDNPEQITLSYVEGTSWLSCRVLRRPARFPHHVPGSGRLAGLPVEQDGPPFPDRPRCSASRKTTPGRVLRDPGPNCPAWTRRTTSRSPWDRSDPHHPRPSAASRTAGPYRSEIRYGSLTPRGQAPPPGSTPADVTRPGTTRESSRSAFPVDAVKAGRHPDPPSRTLMRLPEQPPDQAG